MAGIATHVGHDGGGHTHAGHHIGVGTLGGQHVALGDLVQFQSRTQEAHGTVTGTAGGTIAFHQHFGIGGSLGVHFATAHEDGGGMQLQLFVPAGLGAGLHEPQFVVGVDTEFRIHDHAAVSLAHGTHALGHTLGLAQGQGPAQGFQFRHGHFTGTTAFVIDDLHVLAAHLADDDFTAVIALEDIKLVGGHLAAHHSFAQTVAGIDADQVLAGRAAATGGRIGRESRTGDHGVDHLHHADGKRSVLDGPFLLGVDGDGFIAGLFSASNGIKDSLAAIGHGAQVVRGSTVPMVGFHDLGRAHHVEVGVLQTGKGFLAGVFTGSRRTYGHGGHIVAVLVADGEVGTAHGLIHVLGKIHGQDGGLHHDRTFAQLVDTFGRSSKAFHDGIDEGAQFGVGLVPFRSGSVMDLLAELADELLQEVGVLVDFGIIPVDTAVLAVDDRANDTPGNLGLIQHPVEGERRDGAEIRRLDTFDLADEGRVVVLATHKQLGFFADRHDVGAGQHQLFADSFRGFLFLSGSRFGHDFLRYTRKESF